MTRIRRPPFLAAACLVAATAPAAAQQPARQPAAAAPVGVWRGTSICLTGKPVCKDEVVVYHLERTGPDSAGSVPMRLDANKVVNGTEDAMGALDCRFTFARATLVCPMPPQYAPGEWRFTRDGAKLDGGLWMSTGERVREVHVKHDAPAPATPRGE